MKSQQRKPKQNVTELYRCSKCGAVDKKFKCLCCLEVEAVKYFELLGIGYCDTNTVTLGWSQKFIFSEVADCSPATLFNLNTYTNFRARYSVPE